MMDIDTYRARAIPRLAAIDRLDARCQWGRHLAELSPNEVHEIAALRERRERLMREQIDDEVAAGL